MKLFYDNNEGYCVYDQWAALEKALVDLYLGESDWLKIEDLTADGPTLILSCLWEDGENSVVELLIEHEGEEKYYRQYCYGLAMVEMIFRDFSEGVPLDLGQWVSIEKYSSQEKAARYWLGAQGEDCHCDQRLRALINRRLGRADRERLDWFSWQSLTQLDLHQITRLSSEMTSLLKWHFSETVDISVLVLAENLKELDLSDNQLSGQEVLLQLKKLETLNLSGTNFSDLWQLRRMKRLSTLSIKDCPHLTGAGGLAALTSLQVLYADESFLQSCHLREQLPHVQINPFG